MSWMSFWTCSGVFSPFGFAGACPAAGVGLQKETSHLNQPVREPSRNLSRVKRLRAEKERSITLAHAPLILFS
jgi:hypothetical protein